MSQPNRFRCLTTEEQREFNNKVIMPGLVMCEDGNLVAYSDYAALAADKDIEIKVLQDEVDCIREENAALAAENAALAAENERLRKAGDYLESQFKLLVAEDTYANQLWREAKEGGRK